MIAKTLIILTMTMTSQGNFIPINNYQFKTYKFSKHNNPQNLYLTPTYDLAYPWIHSTKDALKFTSFGPPHELCLLKPINKSPIKEKTNTNKKLSYIKKLFPIKTGNNITKPK